MSTPRIVATYLFLAAVWGGSFLFMRVGVPELGPYAFGGLRLGIAGLVLLPFLLSSKRWAEFRANWLRLSVIGFIATGLPFMLFSFALQSLSAGVGSVINASVPMMTGVIGYVFFQDKLLPRQWLGLLIGIAGVGLLMHDGLSQGIEWIAFAMALSACLCYGIGINLTRHYLAHVSPITTAAATLAVSGVIVSPLVLATFPEQSVSASAWMAVIAVAVLSTALAMVLFFGLVKVLAPTKTATLTLLTPVFGIVWGMLFLGEQLTLAIVVGTLIVLCGTGLSILPKKKAPAT